MRTIRNLTDGWRFWKENGFLAPLEMTKKVLQEGEAVTLPHTWNAVDGQDGGNDYHRGRCWYVRDLPVGASIARPHREGDPAPVGAIHESPERHYLEIGGANHSAEVYLNGELLATHEGGYSTFRVDLTEHLKEQNTLAIAVDNSDSDRVYPQKADFTFYGGLYRDVKLISVPEQHFELLKDGTPGIKVTPIVDLETKTATVTVETWHNADWVDITVNGETKTVASKAEFVIENVRLWDGLDDPYLYTATAKLDSGDEVSTRFGCRVFGFDPEKGFLLNGRVYPLRGVSRHQDLKGKGNALSIEDHKADLEIIKEIGANTLRLAHYQHAQEFYDLCDENGIVVWAEIPYITMHMQNGRQNTLDQMRELIVQCYNHPCIAVWGLSNEITAASAVSEDLLENHRLLNELCHRMDPTRKTVMANVFMLETDSPILEIPDLNSYNLYFGWYLGELEQTDEFFDEYHAKYPDRVIGFSEYGADANPAYHSSHPEKGDYTEEYQALYHEHMLRMIEQRPYLWATHVWNLFDFAADGRDEGGKHGENQKGLVTFDRKTKKDAFYLYKAAWNKSQPFVHLCGKRYINRCEAETEIKVYSNCETVTLYVDGKRFETQRSAGNLPANDPYSAGNLPAKHPCSAGNLPANDPCSAGNLPANADRLSALPGKRIFRFCVPICGEHKVKAIGCRGDQCSEDTMVLRKVDAPEESYIFNKAAATVTNWFDAGELDPSCFSINDTLGELRQNPQAGAILDAMMAKSAAARGDVAESVKDNPALQRMMGRMTLVSLLKQAGADEESIKQLNRVLQGIKK